MRNFRRALCPIRTRKKSRSLVERHIRKLLPKTVTFKLNVHSEGKAWAAPYTHPFFEVAHDALEKGFGKRAVFIREGGSIPFVTQMHDTFKVPCILLASACPTKTRTRPMSTSRWKIISAGSRPWPNFTKAWGS